ncbi:hypothetical protein VOWphi5012_092 [Vibrio phage phi50-12]|uniref:Uncharacterized protein n=1 Tax=Vibrio phage phi50-12 TaxID=2654972 RepID=A0A5P8PRH9_9CAUD|nr:hypothetical protein KNU82_gp092 [Vibrio phage phi50-12]QFR59876.1 hypothetical protein VOWphi5012_092 [Vibrio phage phi50-12]
MLTNKEKLTLIQEKLESLAVPRLKNFTAHKELADSLNIEQAVMADTQEFEIAFDTYLRKKELFKSAIKHLRGEIAVEEVMSEIASI